MGEPDYREIRLFWEANADTIPKNGFNVRYCELQSWGAQRCRLQSVNAPSPNKSKLAVEDKLLQYTTDVKGLRMATTYSFEIKPIKGDKEREDRAEGDDRNENMIVIPTKGFSAKATQCLPQASEIEVSTGPYFAGRIAVEAADGERCAIDGEPKSPRDTYTLRINHEECGSQVNHTTVATFVLVQENLPILTHSTRRFLVLCSYQPDTLTVRAGISLPPTGPPNHRKGQVYAQPASAVVPAEPYEDELQDSINAVGRTSRNLRTGRLMQKPEALVKPETFNVDHHATYRSNLVPIFVITMLSIAGVIGIVAIALKISGKKIIDEMDNISIASEMSISSCDSSNDTNLNSASESSSSGDINVHCEK